MKPINSTSEKSVLTCINFFVVLLLSLMGCEEPDDYRTPTYSDVMGTWSASGLSFESGAPVPTKAQLAGFKRLEAAAYTFNYDSTYVKRSLDSTVAPNTVLVKLEKGTYRLTDNQLRLTTRDTLTKTTRTTYYTCYLATRQLGYLSMHNLIIRTTKELLLKSLNESTPQDALSQQNRDFLNASSLFIVSQTLQK